MSRPSDSCHLIDEDRPPPLFRKRSGSSLRVNLPQLDARLVDPRDIRWEVSSPTYRVYFWRRVGGDALQGADHSRTRASATAITIAAAPQSRRS